MRFNPEIFKAYDIRGVYGQDFDEEFAFRLGAALVQHINKKNFLVAHDDRCFSDRLANSLSGGIISAGANVEYLGLTSTPLFNFAFKKLGVNGGVMLTASHLGPKYSGFKIFGENGAIVGLDSGLEQIKNILTKDENSEMLKSGGKVIKADRQKLVDAYTNFIIKKAGWGGNDYGAIRSKIKFSLAAKYEAEALFNKLGLKNTEQRFDVSFEFDTDADRIYVLDSAEQSVQADHIIALLVKDTIRFWRKPRVVYDLRFSRGVLEKFSKWGVKTIRSRAGRAFMRGNMAKHRADIGGEISGHIYFKENNYNEMPLLTMLRILKIMAQTGGSINELIGPFKTWFNSGEMNMAISGQHFPPEADPPAPLSLGRGEPLTEAFSEILKKIKEKYKDGKIDWLDGVTVEYEDWWFNLRRSNTEPVLRLVVEAKTSEMLAQKIVELQRLLAELPN